MLSSIHPLGERARNMRWGLTASAYVIGSVAGGALLGGALGTGGRLVSAATGPQTEAAALLLALACLAGGALDLGLGGPRLPTIRRQVNEDWLHRYRGWVYGVGFGFQLGAGMATIVTTATVYVTFAAAFLVGLAGSAAGGAAVGAAFGLARSAPILLVARVTAPQQLRLAHRRLQAAAPLWRGLATAVLFVMAATVGAATLA
jgi:hypothetical protein